MSTKEFPMLSSDTDLSDDDVEMIENKSNDALSDAREGNKNSNDDRNLVNELNQKIPSFDDSSANLNSLKDLMSSKQIGDGAVQEKEQNVAMAISNEIEVKERQNRQTEIFYQDTYIEDVEIDVESKDTNSRGSTCHESNGEFEVDLETKSYDEDTASISSGHVEGNVINQFPNIVERESTTDLSACTTSTEFESVKSENFSSPAKSSSSYTTSSYESTTSLNGFGFNLESNPSTPNPVYQTNVQEHVPYYAPELLPNPSPVLARNQIRPLSQQPPVSVLSNNMVSMSSQVNNVTGHPHQERFLITVPADSHYLNNQHFSNNSLPSAHALPHGTISHPPINQSSSGRRSIKLRLVEDIDPSTVSKRIFFKKPLITKSRANSFGTVDENKDIEYDENITDLGTVVVSWYEGTTSTELQHHVYTSVSRKLGKTIDDIRLLDENVFPHEEIVLTPYIPDGSRFMVKFKIRPLTPTKTVYQFASRAPDSPSRAPTPYESEIDPSFSRSGSSSSDNDIPQLPFKSKGNRKHQRSRKTNGTNRTKSLSPDTSEGENFPNIRNKDREKKRKSRSSKRNTDKIVSSKTIMHGNETVEKIIYRKANKKDEKKHVVFVLANYFVLFLSCIAISAEIHERGPRWLQWIEDNVDKVNACAVDRDSLFECISSGDISGLLASIVLWVARNNTLTIRFFLFGFDSVNKLWTVVYEALVTAICWGTSYMFIRRGLNPDTRPNFLEKYWKDAIYGSLAGFNAAFLKAIMKNLIPKEVIEEMVDTNRQLRIVEIFANIFKND